MIKIHNLDRSRSRRIVWLFEELELPYEIIQHQRDPTTMLAPTSLKAIHPLGKSPIIEDGDITLIESGAIIDYVTGRYGNGKLVPAKDSSDYASYLQWLHYAEGSLMPPLVFSLITQMMQVDSEILAGTIDHFCNTHLNFINETLAAKKYFVGADFTAADVSMGYAIESANGANLPGLEMASRIVRYPHLQRYLTELQSRPAYQRSLQAIGE